MYVFFCPLKMFNVLFAEHTSVYTGCCRPVQHDQVQDAI